MLLVEVHLRLRHVGKLAAVGGAADADVGLHLFHANAVELADELHRFFGGGAVERAQDFVRLAAYDREGAALGRAFDELAHECRLGQVEGLDEHLFAALDAATVVEQEVGESVDARVVHGVRGCGMRGQGFSDRSGRMMATMIGCLPWANNRRGCNGAAYNS